MDHKEEEYFLPAEDQRVFGAGIKRKRVQFIRAATADTSQPTPPLTRTVNAGDRYLSIVLPPEKKPTSDKNTAQVATTDATAAVSRTADTNSSRCDICNLPLNPISNASELAVRPHETSLVHQACLVQSHPPSHFDRTRHGLRYLSSYGWDPDSRLGLGAKGEGIRAPLKGKVKNDTVGLGVEDGWTKRPIVDQKPVQKLDAKSVRRKDDEDRKRRERLQEMFYGNADLEKHLSPGE